MKQNIHVWHLEILNPTAQTDAERPYRLEQILNPSPEFARYLYVAVGTRWLWYMRHSWSRYQWQARMNNPAVELWVGYCDGSPVGYFELERQAGNDVEICYFGLTPEHIGRGFGKALLEDAIGRAGELGNRVWLHTCTLDHEHALSNYQARGFTVFREEDIVEDVPDVLKAWPEA